MARWIEDGKITDGDFAYLCGALVTGLSVGKYRCCTYGKRFQFSLTTADNSYGVYVGNVIKRLADVNPSVGEYTYETKFKNLVYRNPRTVMTVTIPIGKIDFWIKSIVLKENFPKLNQLLLYSSKEIQGKFLQAILDAKACLVLKNSKIHDVDVVISVNPKQFPVISSVLSAYGIHYRRLPKVYLDLPEKDPKFIAIRRKHDVKRIVNEIGINSNRVKNKMRKLTGNLYRFD